jgi:hypothetical protein
MSENKEEKPKAKKRSEKYNHSAFTIKGSFDDVIQAAFAKDKKPVKKQE